jgi:hypothetical protein
MLQDEDSSVMWIKANALAEVSLFNFAPSNQAPTLQNQQLVTKKMR